MSNTETITPKKIGRPKKRVGRPRIMTERVIDKLEQAFASGCTDGEACLYAGISTQALYKHQDRYPLFRERKAALKENPVLMARMAVIKAIKTDVDTAKWYLERKAKGEFSPKIEQDTNINVNFTNNIPRPKVAAIERHAISSVPKVIEAEIVKKRA